MTDMNDLVSMVVRLINGETVYAKLNYSNGKFYLRRPIVMTENMDAEKWLTESSLTEYWIPETSIVTYGVLTEQFDEWFETESSSLYDPFAAEAKQDFQRHMKESANG